MPQAYWITTYIKILDVDKVEAYAKLAGPAIAAFDGKYLARGIANYAFESGKKERTVLSIFPTVEKAVSAYQSSAYKKALTALGDGAIREIRIIEASE